MSLQEFKSHLFSLDGIDNNHPRFECIVTFNSSQGVVTDTTVAGMSVTTMEYGDIHLNETDKISLDTHHLDFTQRYQDYSFNGEGLVVTGKSPKMGEYEVTIVPTSAC